MTLASFLSLCVVLSASPLTSAQPLVSPTQSSQNQHASDQPTQKQTSQKAGEAGQSTNTPTAATPPAPSQSQSAPPAATKKGRRKRARLKKSETGNGRVDCPPANSTSGTASADPVSGSTSPSGSSSNQAAEPSNQASNQTQTNQAQTNQPSKNAGANTAPSSKPSPGDCPPAKTVIKDGGTSEPSIQLLGSKGTDVASQQRTSTDQLLESTEDDLKKVAGRQLSSSQQEMVNQIREFIQQSRTAEAAGDTERARNLARKAHLLSDELIKP